MNRTELNSFSMQELEIETLREQLKKEQDKIKLLEKMLLSFCRGKSLGGK